MTIPAWNEDARKARIKAIKAITGRKGLAMDDATYRAMIGGQVPGKRSATELSVPQLDKVLDHLKRLQEKPQAGNPEEWRFVFRLATDRQPHARRIYRLAERIGPLMVPPAPVASKAYIEGIAQQMLQCETVLEFCSPELLHKIVQALEVFCRRQGV